MTGQSIYRCSALFVRIILDEFKHLRLLWRDISQVNADFSEVRKCLTVPCLYHWRRPSGAALKEQFYRLLPGSRFEFVLASSDYIFRKPHSIMYEIALQKSGLTADKVWYCGDSMENDIYGANSVGMFPVLYEGRTKYETHFLSDQNDRDNPDFEYLRIHDWRELMDILA